MSLAFRCLCRKNIPLARDFIAFDGEWQRRYPNMHGTLACERRHRLQLELLHHNRGRLR